MWRHGEAGLKNIFLRALSEVPFILESAPVVKPFVGHPPHGRRVRVYNGDESGGFPMRSTRWMPLLVCFACATPGRAITIITTFESSVPVAAQTAFNNVALTYDAMFSNPITVMIDVAFGATGLGSSSTYIDTVSYSDWRSAMIADSSANPGNAYLAAGVATLPAANPLGSGNAILTFADAMALGFSVSPVTYDSTLTFSNAANTFEYNGIAAPGLYDFQDVAEHELDEALGIGSALTGIANGGALPRNFAVEDYFRYNALGARFLTTSSSAVVYFAYNGVTDVAQFNQNNARQAARVPTFRMPLAAPIASFI
jgi:hypothetical protein